MDCYVCMWYFTELMCVHPRKIVQLFFYQPHDISHGFEEWSSRSQNIFVYNPCINITDN